MDTATENQGPIRTSGLRPPSKIQLPSSPTRHAGLAEMSDAATNSRGPQPATALKHKPTNLPEPAAKRKTLVEAAGEYGRRLPAPSSTRPVNNGVKSTIANGARGMSASTSRAISNPSSRHKTANSFGQSLGHGVKVPSANGYSGRPKTSHGHSRSKSHHQGTRPVTSMRQRDEDDEEETAERKDFYDDRVAAIERDFMAFKEKMEGEVKQTTDYRDTIQQLQSRVTELEAIRTQLQSINEELKIDLKDAKSCMATANMELEMTRRNHSFEVDDVRRKHRNELEDVESKHRKDTDRLRKENEEAAEKTRKEFEAQIDKLLKMHSEELADLQKKLQVDVQEEKVKRAREAQEVEAEYALKLKTAGMEAKELEADYALKLKNAALEADAKQREAQLIQGELTNTKAELDRERSLKTGLQAQLSEATTHNLTLDAANKAMKAKIDFLESDSQAQSEAFNELHRRMQEAIEAAELANEKLRQEETLRRKLHNQVQELKGNIRVMCRIRPTHETEVNPAKISFPDCDTDSKEVSILGPETKSAMGKDTTATYAYSFDRVFSPTAQNGEVFEEISQLVQSALDGYNVCIFCYGQTGSGKTYTMSSVDGMIPRATAQIYEEATRLSEKGWRYRMEGSFVEVYNETYNDLLGRSEDIDKKKVEVRHDVVKKQTHLENTVSIELDGPERVEEILNTAAKNRTVAATKANQRSSRSHSVFILKLVGENHITGEKSEGTLNLVDLAGSERLEHSKAEGARLKETQNINKSLSCLGDVINALGSAKEGSHIPYRNSKLTYLLQYSLGGNSKTLMFVMVSPLQAHLQETITSLKFATKVHNTHIGTAKKQTKTT